MKIEIESNELIRLESKVVKLEDEKRVLIEKLNKFDELEIQRRINNTAQVFFTGAIKKMFSEIGVDDVYLYPNSFSFNDLDECLGENWWDDKNIVITVGATITNKFKEGMVKIGVLK